MNKFSSEQTLVIIILISLIFGFIGIYLDNNYEAMVSIYSFLILGTIYHVFKYLIFNPKKTNSKNF